MDNHLPQDHLSVSSALCHRTLAPRSVCLLRGLKFARFSLVSLSRKHPFQRGANSAVTALLWEAEENGPDERTAAREGGPHIHRHQGKVQKLWPTEKTTLFLQHWTSHHGNFCRADNLGRKTLCSDAFDINCAAFYIWTLFEHLNNLDSKGKMWKHSTYSQRRGATTDKSRSALTVHEALRGSRAYVISWFFHMIYNIVILCGWKFQIMLLFQSKVRREWFHWAHTHTLWHS